MRVAVIAITRNGARLAARLREGLGNAEHFILSKYRGQAGKSSIPFDGELGALVKRLWPEYQGFVCIMATGIVVRMIAPLIESKEKDPAVVVMDDAGRFAISLLSGHLGGANELAERCSAICGSRAVITTATDANDLPSFDMIAKKEGWLIDDLRQVKFLNACLLDGAEIAAVDPTGHLRFHLQEKARLTLHETFIAAMRSGAEGMVLVTNRVVPLQFQAERLLVLRPKNLFLGIGCNRGTTAEEIEEVVTSQLKRLFLSFKSVAAIGSASAKGDEKGLLDFSAKTGFPIRFFENDELNTMDVPSPPSKHALKAIGANGVAEPAALLASGDGKLLLGKVKSGNVTLAIAERA